MGRFNGVAMTTSETITRSGPPVGSAPPDPTRGLGSPHRRFFSRRRIAAAVAVVVLVGGGLGAWFATRPASASTVTTHIVSVGYGTISQSASATGTIAPSNTSDVDFSVSGRVTAVDVAVGQTVTAGQALATVDSAALQAQVDEAQASLDSADAKVSADNSSTSTSSAQLAADEAEVTAAQASLTAAQDSLGDATLTSPIAGTVASLGLTVGQQVSGTSSSSSTSSPSSSSAANSSSQSPLSSSSNDDASSDSSSSSSSAQVVVVGSGSYVVNATVDDTEIGELQTGDQATITPEGATTAVYGQVASVGIVASDSSGVASFPVVIDVTGSPSGLYSGATADIVITVKELQNVLVVPTEAVRFVAGSTAVVVDEGGQQVTRAVTLGTASGDDTQVISGLAAGDQVVERIVTTTGSTGGATTRGRFGGTGLGGTGFGGSGLGGSGFSGTGGAGGFGGRG